MENKALAQLTAALTAHGLSVAGQVAEEPRDEIRAPAPARYRKGPAGKLLAKKLGAGVEPWRHQAEALGALERGENVVLTTPTASGKSLVFQAHALSLTARDDARAIVLYPIKALASDQMRSWAQAAAMAGLPPGFVGEVTGDVPRGLRGDVLARAKILCMTPDVLHAWLMAETADPTVRRFLARTSLVALDEAHVFDAAFGSSTAFLLRRLQAAARLSSAHARIPPREIAFIASSATMVDAKGHLEKLTGAAFTLVDEDRDGSPRRGRSVLHVVADEDSQAVALRVQKSLVAGSDATFIAFCDSRKAVEIMGMASAKEGVMPYRNGYEADDRIKIENGLRSGRLRGVVATSALEMGIDMPSISVGLNLGADATRRSIRQRIGRVGRGVPGAFAVIAKADAFSAYGETFQDYVQGPVEPSNLYLENRFLQFQHARCLHAELDALGARGRKVLPRGISWPDGFADVFRDADPTRAPRAEFADVARLDRGKPHLDYGLRNIGEASMGIEFRDGKRLGTISRANALKESYPAGTYLHMGRGYTVSRWKPGRFGPVVEIRPGSEGITSPIMKAFVNARLDGDGVLEGRIRGSGAAFAAECRLQVRESVIGFSSQKRRVIYGRDSSERQRHRFVKTTGIVLRIPFLDGHPAALRRIGVEMLDRHRRAYGVSPNDVSLASDRIGLRDGSRMANVRDAFAVYDSVHGSLRLSERFLDDLPDLVAELGRGSVVTGADPLEPAILKRMRRWIETLDAQSGPLFPFPGTQDLAAHRAGTVLLHEAEEGAPLREVAVVEPVLADYGQGPALAYVVKLVEGGDTKVLFASDLVPAEAGLAPESWDPDEGFRETGPVLAA